MSHTILSTYSDHRQIAQVEDITTEQPWLWLAAGWRDLRRSPAISIGYGVLFVIASYLITLATVMTGTFYLVPALLGGFFLVAPALGLGLMHAIQAIARHRFQVSTMGAALVVCYVGWFLVANLIFGLMGSGISPSLENAASYLFSLQNLPMLVVGALVGAFFALIVFAFSAVSVPMLLDRDDVDALSAMRISYQACRYNPLPMLVWAALIVLIVLGGFATLYVGLAIGFPLLAHATWHAYRELIKP